MDHGEAETIKRMLAEHGVDAERALEVLIGTLVRDHVKHHKGHLNDPTTLWALEKALWEERNASEGDADAAAKSRAEVQGILSILLMTCRELGEDQAAARKKLADDRPPMRIVRD